MGEKLGEILSEVLVKLVELGIDWEAKDLKSRRFSQDTSCVMMVCALCVCA